jgi:uncharacterized protein with FMN-binding domain
VSRAGRKGRIPNELVAASCAAIIAVYAAGSWRTRDEAKRFTAEGQMRRPVRPASAPVAAAPVAIAVAASAAEQAPNESRPATTPLKVEAAPSVASVNAPQSSSRAASPVVAATAVEEKTVAEPVADVATDVAEAAPAHNPWLDGYYTGWGTSPHGDIQAFVTIKDGRIVNSGIATCETRYPCYVIDQIIPQPVELQGPDVDRVSRATESGDAYYWGLVKALENAETGTFRSVRP